MIELKISQEMLTDLFTPSVVLPHKCVEGLPAGAKLTSIIVDNIDNSLCLFFDDGEEHPVNEVFPVKTVQVKFESVIPFLREKDKHDIVQKLLFETEDEAQKLLRKEYPGYRVSVAINGDAILYDPNDKVVLKITGDKESKFDKAMKVMDA